MSANTSGTRQIELCGSSASPIGVIIKIESSGVYQVVNSGIAQNVPVSATSSAITAGDVLVTAAGGTVKKDDGTGTVIGTAVSSALPGATVEVLVNISVGAAAIVTEGDILGGSGVSVTGGTNVLLGSDAVDVTIGVTFGTTAGTVSEGNHTHDGSTITHSLQDAYNDGNTIALTPGTPVSISTTGSGNIGLVSSVGAARAIEARNNSSNEDNAALWAYNLNTDGVAVYSNGHLRMANNRRIYSNSDLYLQLDKDNTTGANNSLYIYDGEANITASVSEEGVLTINKNTGQYPHFGKCRFNLLWHT